MNTNTNTNTITPDEAGRAADSYPVSLDNWFTWRKVCDAALTLGLHHGCDRSKKLSAVLLYHAVMRHIDSSTFMTYRNHQLTSLHRIYCAAYAGAALTNEAKSSK